MSYSRPSKLNFFGENPTIDEINDAFELNSIKEKIVSIRDNYIIVHKDTSKLLPFCWLKNLLSDECYKGNRYIDFVEQIIKLYDLFVELQHRMKEKYEVEWINFVKIDILRAEFALCCVDDLAINHKLNGINNDIKSFEIKFIKSQNKEYHAVILYLESMRLHIFELFDPKKVSEKHDNYILSKEQDQVVEKCLEAKQYKFSQYKMFIEHYKNRSAYSYYRGKTCELMNFMCPILDDENCAEKIGNQCVFAYLKKICELITHLLRF